MAIEDDMIARRKQPFEAITKTDYLPPQFLGGEDNSAQDRIQPGAITTAR